MVKITDTRLTGLSIKDVACFVSSHLRANGIDAILVGGTCVSIYTKNLYESFDIDFVTSSSYKALDEALAKIGFVREGRIYVNRHCKFSLDFVDPPVAVGEKTIHEFKKQKTSKGTVVLLTPQDCACDRLAAFYYWRDTQALHQAVLVAAKQPFSLIKIRQWSKKEGMLEGYQVFLREFKEYKSRYSRKSG